MGPAIALLLSDMPKRETAFNYETLHWDLQETLIDFLDTELKIGASFTKSAFLHRNDDRDHYARSKSNAIKASKAVRRFVTNVEDPNRKAKILSRLSELERLIASV